MIFSRESYTDTLVADMRPLWDAHDREVPQLHMKMDPDLKAYKAMSDAGILRIYTARVSDLLVGYQVYFVGDHPHRRASREATQDILYLDPEVRKGLTGLKFIKWCDTELEKEGVRVIHHPIDARHDFGHVLERMGYQLTDLTYSREVICQQRLR